MRHSIYFIFTEPKLPLCPSFPQGSAFRTRQALVLATRQHRVHGNRHEATAGSMNVCCQTRWSKRSVQAVSNHDFRLQRVLGSLAPCYITFTYHVTKSVRLAAMGEPRDCSCRCTVLTRSCAFPANICRHRLSPAIEHAASHKALRYKHCLSECSSMAVWVRLVTRSISHCLHMSWHHRDFEEAATIKTPSDGRSKTSASSGDLQNMLDHLPFFCKLSDLINWTSIFLILQLSCFPHSNPSLWRVP